MRRGYEPDWIDTPEGPNERQLAGAAKGHALRRARQLAARQARTGRCRYDRDEPLIAEEYLDQLGGTR